MAASIGVRRARLAGMMPSAPIALKSVLRPPLRLMREVPVHLDRADIYRSLEGKVSDHLRKDMGGQKPP